MLENGGNASTDERTEQDLIANESGLAGHMLTTGADDGQPPHKALELHGRHVLDFIGWDKQWHSLGVIAIQSFRPDGYCVYFIGGDEGAIKIGVSMAPLERLATMQMGSPIRLRILALVAGDTAVEREYHRRFADHRSHGEWFSPHPDILAEIARLQTLAA